jgi:hypothetical protein
MAACLCSSDTPLSQLTTPDLQPVPSPLLLALPTPAVTGLVPFNIYVRQPVRASRVLEGAMRAADQVNTAGA